MKWKNRLTNYNFWISIVSATLLILQAFDVKLDIANINEIITALLGLLVVIGIINDPTKSSKSNEASVTTESSTQQSSTESLIEPTTENPDNDTSKTDLPSETQIAYNYDNAENDLQILVDKIYQDLQNKYEELNNAVGNLNANKTTFSGAINNHVQDATNGNKNTEASIFKDENILKVEPNFVANDEMLKTEANDGQVDYIADNPNQTIKQAQDEVANINTQLNIDNHHNQNEPNVSFFNIVN